MNAHFRRDNPPRLGDHLGNDTDPDCTHSWQYNAVGWNHDDLGPSVITSYCGKCKAVIRFTRDSIPIQRGASAQGGDA